MLDKSGLLKIQHLETEVVGSITTQAFNSCKEKRGWKGMWPIFYLTLSKNENTAIEYELYPFVRAISETSGMCCTLMKSGNYLIQIGGNRFRFRMSIADAI